MTLNDSLVILELKSVDLIDISVVKTAYRRLQKMWHPDLHIEKESYSMAHTKAVQINLAFEVITEYLERNGTLKNTKNRANTFTDENKTYTPSHKWKKNYFTPGFPDENVFEIFVKSSNILSIGFSYNNNILYIKFQSNSVYEYKNVPVNIFNEFLYAYSHGKYAHKYIYPFYIYRSCSEPNKPYKGSRIVNF